MSKTTETTYASLDEPYNDSLERKNAQVGFAASDSTALASVEDSSSGAPDTYTPGSPSASGAPIVQTPSDMGPGSIPGQALDNLTITNWIKSRGYQPKKLGFYLDGKTGYAEFSNLLVTGSSTIGGTLIVGTGNPYILIDGVNGTIGTSNFASGAAGWRIDADGSAEFNNITARGEFRTGVFVKDEVHATGGSLLIVPASVLLNDFTSVTTPATSTLDLKDPPSGHAQLFAVNDFIRIKDGSGKDNWLKVTVVSDQTTFYRYTVDKQSGTNGTFYAGTAVVNYRQATDGFILATSDASNSPYIDISVTGATPWSGVVPKVRIGKLSGITDANFGTLSGYGIYTQNGYFTGTVMGTTIIGGVIETATSGQRVVINDSSDNTLRFFDSAGQVIGIGTTAGRAMSIVLNNTTNFGFVITGNVASGALLDYQNSYNGNARGMNINLTGATNNLDCIDLVHNGTGSALAITTTNAAQGILSQSSGSGLCFYGVGSGSAIVAKFSQNSNVDGVLIEKNTSGAGIALNVLNLGSGNGFRVDNDGTGYGIYIDQSNASNSLSALNIVNAGSGRTIEISQSATANANALFYAEHLGTGPVGVFNTGNQTSSANAFEINSGSNRSGSVLYLGQSTTTSTNFKKMMDLDGTRIWKSNGTSPNGSLSGTAGDFCLNGSGNRPYWCGGGTTWTQI